MKNCKSSADGSGLLHILLPHNLGWKDDFLHATCSSAQPAAGLATAGPAAEKNTRVDVITSEN